MSAENGLGEAVFFPFDRQCVPFRHSLQMQLLRSRWDDRGPVLSPGSSGSPDSESISFYGTVMQVDGKIRMWYLAGGDGANERDLLRICYAESTDGIHFTKPNLGIVNYGGNKDNNLVDTGIDAYLRGCVVLHDPQDPDPARLYKLFVEGNDFRGCVAFSPDGLRWKAAQANPVTVPTFEPTGLVKRDGCYYVLGQTAGETSSFLKRVLCVMASYDFEHWTTAMAMGFRRDDLPPRPFQPGYNMGKQVHIGAGLWDRGSVILGLYGQWDGAPDDDDRRYLKMNLGLVVSHDGMNYEEPIPDFQMVRNIEEGWTQERPMGYPPRLAQGQGMVQVGDRTFAYYSHWGKGASNQIWIASWERDRLGYYSPTTSPDEGQWMNSFGAPHFITCPIKLHKSGVKFFVNAGRLSDLAYLTFEVLDLRFKPIAGYTVDDCVPVKGGGFRVPLTWKGHGSVSGIDRPVRLRVVWNGVRPEDARVYAVYAAADK